jgi:hypothetical protein
MIVYGPDLQKQKRRLCQARARSNDTPMVHSDLRAGLQAPPIWNMLLQKDQCLFLRLVYTIKYIWNVYKYFQELENVLRSVEIARLPRRSLSLCTYFIQAVNRWLVNAWMTCCQIHSVMRTPQVHKQGASAPHVRTPNLRHNRVYGIILSLPPQFLSKARLDVNIGVHCWIFDTDCLVTLSSILHKRKER